MKIPSAFNGYPHRDDAAYGHRITGLRQKLQGVLVAASGRDFKILLSWS
jgi:hypothetical protein